MSLDRARTVALMLVGSWMFAGVAPAVGWPAESSVASAIPDAAERGEPADDAVNSGFAAILSAWRAPAESLDQRAQRVRRASIEQGLWNVDPAAHALLRARAESDSSIARAEAAVYLSPDLPAARMALARALWFDGKSPIAAVRAAWGALLAIPRHLEASLWFGGTAFCVLAIALFVGGLVAIAVSAAFVAPHAAHDLGDVVFRKMPALARAAFLAAAVLMPLGLGQGLLGLAAGLLTIAMLYASPAQRWVLGLAAGCSLFGAYPLARLAGTVLTAYSAHPVFETAYSVSEGFADPIDLRRLEEADASDPLVLWALAVMDRRTGNLRGADANYQRLMDLLPDDPAVANNAANVKLALGDIESAQDLYRRSSSLRQSAPVLFNLSQAYGKVFQVDDLNQTLAAAQRLDRDVLAELTRLQGIDPQILLSDLPVNFNSIWPQVFTSRAGALFAAEQRSRVSPGILGRDGRVAAGVFFLVGMASALLGRRLRPSHGCLRCGQRMCPRCDPESRAGEVCEACSRLYHQPETTDRVLRLTRIHELGRREKRRERVYGLVSILIPGAAGLMARRYWMSLIGAVAAPLAITAWVYRYGVVADPFVAGRAAPVAFGALALLSVFVYAIVATLSLRTNRGI